MLALNLKNNMA